MVDQWPTVDKSRLHTMADCETWEDFDYFVYSQGVMLALWITLAVNDARAALRI